MESPRNPETEIMALKDSVVESAIELSESDEVFSFPGLKSDSYEKIKAEQEEDPGFITTPIDELIERCRNEGIKVVLTTDPRSGNFMLLPASSDNIIDDLLMPETLETNTAFDSELLALLRKREAWARAKANAR